MRILVVDDEDLLVKGIRFNLQNDGYEVITGSNGVEAIEAAKAIQKRKEAELELFNAKFGNFLDHLGNYLRPHTFHKLDTADH